MKNKLTYILIFLFCSLISFGQTNGDLVDINPNNITSWKVEKEKYYGTYSFGFSENESELRIFGNDTITIAQHKYNSWDGKGWYKTFITFTNVKIIDSKFYSDQYNGIFIEFKTYDEGETLKGLHLDKYLTSEYSGDNGEIGSKNKTLIEGEYPESSTSILSYSYLKSLKLNKLKIMRNEIFARYAYKFKKGGEMNDYFSNKDWYYAEKQNVSELLTIIEQENIIRIKQIEKEKR
ncbi:YARHG domain-containing protein [Cellulophaga sp. 20_2_10]|uniref:YARHG domain-containing protein n=1 Tax=Cellulophaga sp. 20_2_10 TaxID=2942476 RepID=UPI00201AA446|nr:YARHG domain-containing protein [Cellulophaga sp. 20_2_10]MCL5247774.1 YARHG domain-containing protein [Cellulophaga sp. 20_2_10]